MTDILERKADHIDAVLLGDVGFDSVTSGFEKVRFAHTALPELSLNEIDTHADFLGYALEAPFIISSMTGGPKRAEHINRSLAEAAAELGIAFAVGSQRVAMEEEGAAGLSFSLRECAPSVPIIGNLGAAQLVGPGGVDRARKAVEMVEADALYIHLNPLQEAVQRGGDTDWRGVVDAIATLARTDIVVAVKEVGFGLSERNVSTLIDIGVDIIDVAGAGGTNWAKVEGARGHDRASRAISSAFADWGIPTVDAVAGARRVLDEAGRGTLIASGGIKNGIEAAAAIRLGADLVGQAAGTLAAAVDGTEAVIEHFRTLAQTLRIACFCTGSASLSELKNAELQRV